MARPARLNPEDERVIRAIVVGLGRFAAAVAPRDDDAEDLVQEALVRVLVRHPLAELDDPLVYLRRVVLNLANNRRRSIRRRLAAMRRLGAAADHTDQYPSELVALLELTPQTRAVLWLADVEGLDFERIAEQLGLSPSAARQRASRGRAALRTKIQEGTFDAPQL